MLAGRYLDLAIPTIARETAPSGHPQTMLLPVIRTWAAAVAIAMAGPSDTALGQSVEEFYKNGTINLYVGSGAGGGYDATARVFARFYGKHIPGKPNVVVRNQPGAGGLTNANYMFHGAPRDGSAIAATFNTVMMLPRYGDSAARFDPRKFSWIGSTDKQTGTCLTWHDVPVKTVDDARQREVIVGTTALNDNPGIYPAVMNAMFNTRFKIVGGYTTATMRLALERREIDSICGIAMQTHMAVNPQWFINKQVNVLTQFGLQKHRDLPDVPLALDMLTNQDDKKVFELLVLAQEFGRPYLAPPEIPFDRFSALKMAFDATLKDPEFIAQSAKSRQGIDPMNGEQIMELLDRVYAAPQNLVDRAAKFSRAE